MARAFVRDQRLASAGAQFIAVDDTTEFSFEDVEDLVLIPMDMKRRRVAVTGPDAP